MCGLNGVFAYGAGAVAPDRAELIATRDHMRARGPDGDGEWWSADRRVGMGHRRLAIIDLDARAAQPMLSDDAALTITFNGEIYNYIALRKDLELKGVRFRTTSDTEVILKLYEHEGAGMVSKLRGMFAFGLYDARKDGLLLARDPYGIKPLYYSADGGTVRFASQVKALLAGGGVSRELDLGGLAGFHIFGYVPEPFTTYRAISAVPSGSTLWIDADGVGEPRPFASIAGAFAAGRHAPAGDLVEAVREAALDSVRHHLVADVEVGAFLSGGVDSGAVLGLMRDAGQSRIRTLTLAFDEFDGAPMDESPLAEKAAARYGADHTTRRVTQAEFNADLPAILEAMDQPSIDGINTWFVAKATKELGLKVALSGLGGDELLAGYPSFRDLPRWRRRIGPVARIPGSGAASATMIRLFAPGLARENPKMLGMVRYAGTWAGAYVLRRAVRLPEELGAVMGPDAARDGLRRLDLLRRLDDCLVPDPGSDVGRVAALESQFYMRNQLLRDSDWAGMAHSLEIRTPLVDYTLLRALAPYMPRMTAGAGKLALAQAPSKPLSAETTERAKVGFTIPIGAWTKGAASTPHRLDSRRWASRVLGEAVPEVS
jgi:asparagine synthase (glutamine-hydrolysing)